jgi:hypothetical protein
MTCMVGFVDGDIPSTDGCITLRCPNGLLSLVDTSFRAFPHYSYQNANTETERSIASQDIGTKRLPNSETLRLLVANALRHVYQDVRHAAKIISRIGISPDSANKYLYGSRSPNGWNLVQLMAQNRKLRTDVDRLVNELEAIYATDKSNKKTNNTVRSDDAEYRVRGRATARLGCC